MGISSAIRTFLAEARFASLATINPDGSPQQTVMWYVLRGDTIVMNTARGRQKDKNLLRDQRLSVCVEDGYRYVAIDGQAELNVDQSTAQADIRELAIRYQGESSGEEMVRDVFASQYRISIYLRVTDIDAHGFDA